MYETWLRCIDLALRIERVVVLDAKDFVVFKVMLNGIRLISLAIISKLKDLMLNFFLVIIILFLMMLNR